MGFEPTDAFTSPVFKTGSFDRSDSSPFLATRLIIAKKQRLVNTFLLFFIPFRYIPVIVALPVAIGTHFALKIVTVFDEIVSKLFRTIDI